MDGTAAAAIQPSILPAFGELLLEIDNFLNLGKEPPIDLRKVEDFFDGKSGAQRVTDEEDALGIGDGQLACDDIARENVAVAVHVVIDPPGFAITAEAIAANFEGAQAFLQRFFESAPNGHRFAD